MAHHLYMGNLTSISPSFSAPSRLAPLPAPLLAGQDLGDPLDTFIPPSQRAVHIVLAGCPSGEWFLRQPSGRWDIQWIYHDIPSLKHGYKRDYFGLLWAC